jgi:hypothetical protein
VALRQYVHSGKTGSLGTLRVLALGLLGSSALGGAYAYALLYNPFVSLSPLLTLILGGFSGFITGLGADIGQVRNSRRVLGFGAFFGLVFIYVSWVIWFRATSDHQVLVFLPWDMAEVLFRVLDSGSFEILGWKPREHSLLGIWFLEVMSAALISAVMSWGVIAKTPYCEQCFHWVEEGEELELLESLPGIESLRERLETGDLGRLLRLKPVGKGSSDYLRITLNHCSDCESFHLLSLHSVTALTNVKGRKIREDEVWENILISRKGYEALRGKWGLKPC